MKPLITPTGGITMGSTSIFYVLDTDVGRLANAEIEHVKRALRRAYVESVWFHYSKDSMVDKLNACVKRELAKFGKAPRLFVTYDAGCMYANELPEFIKLALSNPFVFEPGQLSTNSPRVVVHVMAKPRADSLSLLFQQLIDATVVDGTVCVVIYSDDSVYTGSLAGRPFAFNADITSNDSSNCEMTFAVTCSLLARFNLDAARGLLRQCMMPITVRNPNEPSEFIRLQFHSAFEGSGTVLTSILNHVVSYLIAITFGSLVGRLPPHLAIQRAASMCGHLMTIDDCCPGGSFVAEKLQFLKYSPVRTTAGTYVPTLNYGAIFRSFGSFEEDLMAKHLCMSVDEFRLTPVSDRMHIFLSGVVRGLKHEPNSTIMAALRSRFCSEHATDIPKRYFDEMLSGDGDFNQPVPWADGGYSLTLMQERENFTLEEASLCRRYDITFGEVAEFAAAVSQTKLGSHSVTAAASHFFFVDYGAPIE